MIWIPFDTQGIVPHKHLQINTYHVHRDIRLFAVKSVYVCNVHVSNTNPHIASDSTGHHAQQTHRVRQMPHRYHSINYYFQLVSRKSSVTDKAVSVYSMSHSNYIWIGECRLGRLGGFRYSERKDSSSNWLWINMQIQEYYIKFPLLSEGRGGPETFRRPGMPHGVFEKWIRRSRLLRLSSQLSAWWRDDLCKQRGDRQGKRERRALGMDTDRVAKREDWQFEISFCSINAWGL